MKSALYTSAAICYATGIDSVFVSHYNTVIGIVSGTLMCVQIVSVFREKQKLYYTLASSGFEL